MEDIMEALEFHDLKPAKVFTSEDAKSYKPRKESFELALRGTGLKPEEVLHIGDSLTSDVDHFFPHTLQPYFPKIGLVGI